MSNGPTRRSALKTFGAVAASPVALDPAARVLLRDQAGTDLDSAMLDAIAEAVLPTELDAQGRARVVADFLRWIQNYRVEAETDHGYGFTRIRSTGASPATTYPEQFAALERAAATAKTGSNGKAFVGLSVDARRAAISAALVEARIERLPTRPNGAHIAADLMGFYFNSPAALDLCYRAQIGRDRCRGLEGSEKAPAPLAVEALVKL
jgi:hypothetical protein